MEPELRLGAPAIPVIDQLLPPSPRGTSARTTPVSELARLGKHAAILLAVAVLSPGAYLIISRYFVQQVEVVGESMLPTLRDRGHYLLNRWALRRHNPQVKDVVVLVDPEDHGLSVKRVVAVAGDTIRFSEGGVYVNGRELREPYLAARTHTFTPRPAGDQTVICGRDQYYVLGDNRARSIDSRCYGPVPRDTILGVLMVH